MNHLSVILTVALALPAAPARAGWWIFGQAGNEIRLNYLQVDGVSFDETGPKITVYEAALKDGRTQLKGRASVRKGKIGLVEVTSDGGATWQKAQLSAAGDFLHAFPVEAGKTYKLQVKVTDTSGKTNDVAATSKELLVSDKDMRGEVKAALDGMVAAYMAEDPVKFMAYVASDFASDPVVLDRAVRKDFSNFDGIQLSYTLDNIASSDGGLTAVSISYRRMLVSAKSGQTATDQGSTQFVFRLGESSPQAYSMKAPLIFGLSDASEVATGTQPGNTTPVTVVDDGGNVSQVPPSQIEEQGEGGGSQQSVAAKDSTMPAGQGFRFSDETVIANPPIPNGADIAYNPGGPGNIVFRTGMKYRALGAGTNVDAITSVTDQAAGYTTSAANDNVALGLTNGYEFYTTSGKYGVLAIKTINAGVSIVVRYKYQPSGARTF
ncbi:MAG: hypothetical protein FD126_2203 [Elusimicrobia bacterium]|nr:MAG: hypothetical protein FD126_2203 [Elusimicrobiota bacterium]